MKINPAFRYAYLSTSVFQGRGEERKTEVARPKAETAATRQVDPKQLQQAVKEINDHLQLVRRNLEFSVDKDTRQIVVKVIDAETGEVVRQIPPDAVLELAKFLREREGKGLFLAQQV
ncbi:flagellar protein FlaG [Methylothermus subterraneus]